MEHSPAIFSKDGSELFWSYYNDGEHVIMYMRQVKEFWEPPVKFVSTNELKDGNPFFSSGWDKLIFHSGRKEKRKDGSLNLDFWYVERENDGWSTAKLLDFPPNSKKWQLYGCQVANGNIYYTGKLEEQSKEFQLCVSTFNGETWSEAILMDEKFNCSAVNWTPYVSPDESYIIFSSDRKASGKGYDACDLYISYKDENNEWSEPIDMGENINTNEIERFPWVSPDGKYLFFVRGFGDVYWVTTKIIEKNNID